MPKGLPRTVNDNIEKCRSAAIAAVAAYNQPGPRFRTAQYLVMITIAWTAALHAVFYKYGRRPWYRKKTSEREKVSGMSKSMVSQSTGIFPNA